jgi:hypothetical protein
METDKLDSSNKDSNAAIQLMMIPAESAAHQRHCFAGKGTQTPD